MADKSRQQTIRGKFLRVTIPLIFLTVIGAFSVVELMNYKNAIDQLHETLAGMIATQSAALATPVWNLDREQIQLSLEAVVANREIVTARIYGENTTLMLEVVDQAVSGDHMILRRDIVYDAAGSYGIRRPHPLHD